MSQRAFTACIEALRDEQQQHILTMRRMAAIFMDLADYDHTQVEDWLRQIDEAEQLHKELLSGLVLLNEVSS